MEHTSDLAWKAVSPLRAVIDMLEMDQISA